MSDLAIRVENLSKLYKLGGSQHDSLSELLAHWMRGVFRHGKPARHHHHHARDFWALKGVSFEVEHGEVVGVIGRNGAGKSTLLKVLSRITQPTTGRAEIHGRVGSLLEVGTGFHPELSGEENIYLSGAILGMKKAEINRRFDEIVAFAEVEEFLDIPVKRYSSGMYVRLAFAVAAHLQPEILIIDEVLAVGDAAFQKKCLGKMGETAKGGRTVFFVSHNMLSIQSLCTRTILLKGGAVQFDGPTQQAVTEYLESLEQVRAQPIAQREDRGGGEMFRFTGVEFLNPQTLAPYDVLSSGQSVIIRLKYVNRSADILKDVGVSIAFFTMTGAHLCGCRSRAVGVTWDVPPSQGYADCLIPRWPLNAGDYSFHLFAEQKGHTQSPIDWVQDAGVVHVESGDFYGFGVLPSAGHQGVFIDYRFQKGGADCDGVPISMLEQRN